jgi:hypothetical protein
MGRKKGITKELIAWRRNQIASLLARGADVNSISKTLQISSRLVYEDIRWIRINSSKILRNYLADTLPAELSKCLLRLNQVSNESWSMVDNKQLHAREKLAALARAESSAVNIIELLTNNKELVYTALGRKKQPLIESRPSTSCTALSQSSEREQYEDENNGDNVDSEPVDEDYQDHKGQEDLDHEFPAAYTQRDTEGQDPERVF